MCNGKDYTEVRNFQQPNYMMRFYFITRCYSSYVETVIADLCQPPYPDIIIMNSCLWDITRLADQYNTTLLSLMLTIDWLFGLVISIMIASGQSNLTKGCIAVAHERYSLYFTVGRPFPHKITSSHGGSGPPSNTWFLGPPESTIQRVSRLVQPFCRAHDRDRQRDLQTTLCQ